MKERGVGFSVNETIKNIIETHGSESFIDDWKQFRSFRMTAEEINKLPRSREKYNLALIYCMLEDEGYLPWMFIMSEMPLKNVYNFESLDRSKWFDIEETSRGKIKPMYLTKECNKAGYNWFPTMTIKEAIEKMEV